MNQAQQFWRLTACQIVMSTFGVLFSPDDDENMGSARWRLNSIYC
jgi:hypothetical protein